MTVQLPWMMGTPMVSSEKAMAAHSSTLAWEIPWMEEPGRLLFLHVDVQFFHFPCGSTGKESTCNAGGLGSIPGLGRSPGAVSRAGIAEGQFEVVGADAPGCQLPHLLTLRLVDAA